mgnify:CR=1 FL=1
MFTLKPGSLDQYDHTFIKLLSEVDESKYIFNAYVTHAYEDSSYNYITDTEELATKLSEDLLERNLKVIKVENLTSPSTWPEVIVQNSIPMKLAQFIAIINDTYFGENPNFIFSECLDVFEVVTEV